MQLQFTNRQIYFAISLCFPELHFRLRTHLQDLVLANDAPDHLQTVTISAKQLAQVYKSTSTIAEGEARRINGEMKDSLLPQLMQLSGADDPEALEAIELIQAIDQANENTAEQKILSGKSQILS